MSLAAIYAALFYFICHFDGTKPRPSAYLPRPAPITHANHK